MKNVRAPINQSNFIHHNREKQIGSYQRHDYSTGKVPRLSQSQRLEEPQSPNRSLPPSSAYTKGSSVVVKQKGNSFRERERWIQREVIVMKETNQRSKDIVESAGGDVEGEKRRNIVGEISLNATVHGLAALPSSSLSQRHLSRSSWQGVKESQLEMIFFLRRKGFNFYKCRSSYWAFLLGFLNIFVNPFKL